MIRKRNITYITIFVALLYSTVGFTQKFILDSIKKEHAFIKYDLNQLKFVDSSAAFQKLFKKLDAIATNQEEKVHVFHIGGSHIQADFYSHKLRAYLQNMSTTSQGQRGMVFPYRMAKTNNPINYNVSFDGEWKGYRCSVKSDSITWGMNGVTAQFKDSISNFTVRANHRGYKEDRYNFNKIRVFYDEWTEDYQVTLAQEDLIKQQIRNSKAHFIEFELTKTVDTLELCVKRTIHDESAEFLMMGIELMNDSKGIEYTSIGVNGASFESYERCYYFEDQLLLYKPDLFIISVGTNDTYTTDFKPEKYRNYYEGFIQLILRANPDCAILLTVPNDSYYKRRYANPNTQIAAEVIYDLAKKYNMAVWDFYEIMGGLGSSQKWYRKKLMPRDRIHFTRIGYNIKGDLLLEALVNSWAKTMHRDPKKLLNQITNTNNE